MNNSQVFVSARSFLLSECHITLLMKTHDFFEYFHEYFISGVALSVENDTEDGDKLNS